MSGRKKMDKKYIGNLFKVTGQEVPPEEWFVFRAQDKAVVPMLETYYNECKELGCDETHLTSILALKDRVVEFQTNVRCKVPDTAPEEIVEMD